MSGLLKINDKRPLSLFEGFGVEMEYMIVEQDTLNVLPISDKVLETAAGNISSEYSTENMAWSNELVLHVIEIKTDGPAISLDTLSRAFQQQISDIETILRRFNARLMPGAIHPWMDPDREMKLWPHEYNPIYEAYNRIFDCCGHGWANLQSTHLNLPFNGDDEFGKLHAATRLILPLIPAMATSSPIADGRCKPFLDYRMEVYRTNSIKVPSVTGNIIPEPVFTREDYDREIFQRMYRDIAPFDPDGILQEEWLNSRGAMSRWDRQTIEIRVIDIQEYPGADIAILEWIVHTTKALTAEKWTDFNSQKSWSDSALLDILLQTIELGENAVIRNQDYLSLFGCVADSITAGELCEHIFSEIGQDAPFTDESRNHLKLIFRKGTLASRILRSLPDPFAKADLHHVYQQLCNCLRDGKSYRA